MGYRVMQRIFECAICGAVPEDGELLWELCRDHWCEACCDRADDVSELIEEDSPGP